MSTLIVLTDFSASSRNALKYACNFVPAQTDLLLLHIYEPPLSYLADGVAIAALRDSIESSKEDMENELIWANENFPQHSIRYKEVMGEFITVLTAQCQEEHAGMIIMGTPTDGNSTTPWETNTLSVLTDLSVPVLTIPQQAVYKPIQHIGFACKPENIKDYTPINTIAKLVNYTKAKLSVVRVVTPGSDEQTVKEGEQLLREKLGAVAADYYTIEGKHITENISRFIQDHQVDMLLIRPKKHGVWYKIFNADHSRQLAAMDTIPVIALHESNSPQFLA